MVRFLLEVFFELMICALINVTSFATASKAGWVFSLLTIITAFAAILFIGAMFFRGGPNVTGTYAPATFLSSFWGVRQLHEDVRQQALSLEEQKS